MCRNLDVDKYLLHVFDTAEAQLPTPFQWRLTDKGIYLEKKSPFSVNLADFAAQN
jgi:hypothetical protein